MIETSDTVTIKLMIRWSSKWTIDLENMEIEFGTNHFDSVTSSKWTIELENMELALGTNHLDTDTIIIATSNFL